MPTTTGTTAAGSVRGRAPSDPTIGHRRDGGARRRHRERGKLPPVPDLVAIDLPGGPGLRGRSAPVWDQGDAVLPVDQRLAPPARAALLAALRPAVVVTPDGARHAGPAAEPRRRRRRPGGRDQRHHRPAQGGGPDPAAVAASARATSARLGVDPVRHRWLACLPLNHVGGLSVVTRALLTGTPVIVLPGFDAGTVIGHARPDTFVSLVPTALRRVGAADASTPSCSAGRPRRETWPANVVTTYGLTETGSGVVYDGLPLDGVEVAIDPLSGEIRLRGPMLLRAYRDGTVPPRRRRMAGHRRRRADRRRAAACRSTVASPTSSSPAAKTSGRPPWRPFSAATPGWPRWPWPGARDDPEWGQRVVAWVVPDRAAPRPTLDGPAGARQRAAGRLRRAPQSSSSSTALPSTPSARSGGPGLRLRGPGPASRVAGMNRLADETSPYLRQHADNPVDWYPWGDEALRPGDGRGQAHPAVGRLLGLPLVPRDGPRVLRGPGHGGGHEPPVRQHQGRPGGATRRRQRLHGGGAGRQRQRRVADDGVPACPTGGPSSPGPTFPGTASSSCWSQVGAAWTDQRAGLEH